MADEVDKAQASEETDRALALERQRRIADSFLPRDFSVDGRCLDCEQPIEPARLSALDFKTSRCASCAQDFARRRP